MCFALLCLPDNKKQTILFQKHFTTAAANPMNAADSRGYTPHADMPAPTAKNHKQEASIRQRKYVHRGAYTWKVLELATGFEFKKIK